MWDVPSADLPEKYQLSYLIGEVVRNDVFAESETRMLWRKLQEAGLLEADKLSFGRLFSKLRHALASPLVPADFRRIALDVLGEMDAAHKVRNEYAHTIFLHYPEHGSELVRAARPGPLPRKLDDIEKGARRLLTATWRMRGVWIIAPFWIGGEADDYESADDLRSWTRVAMGHIADTPGQVIGTPGPAPEPPGGYGAGAATQPRGSRGPCSCSAG